MQDNIIFSSKEQEDQSMCFYNIHRLKSQGLYSSGVNNLVHIELKIRVMHYHLNIFILKSITFWISITTLGHHALIFARGS